MQPKAEKGRDPRRYMELRDTQSSWAKSRRQKPWMCLVSRCLPSCHAFIRHQLLLMQQGKGGSSSSAASAAAAALSLSSPFHSTALASFIRHGNWQTFPANDAEAAAPLLQASSPSSLSPSPPAHMLLSFAHFASLMNASFCCCRCCCCGTKLISKLLFEIKNVGCCCRRRRRT